MKQKKEQRYAKQREEEEIERKKRCYMGNSSEINKKLELENLMLVRKRFIKKETKVSIFAAND